MSSASTGGIKQLLDAEKQASDVVKQAKNRAFGVSSAAFSLLVNVPSVDAICAIFGLWEESERMGAMERMVWSS
jgi:hypothetical protein